MNDQKAILMIIILFAVYTQHIHSLPKKNYPKIISYTNEVFPDSYNFAFETEDGVRRNEKGEFVNGVWTVIGSATWTDKDGTPRSYAFTADDKGVILKPTPATGQ